MIVPKTVEIAKGIYWVGSGLQETGLYCNPYLIVDGEEAVLIDPGSVLDFEYIYANVCSLVPLEKIKYVILHHQDADFCSAVPLFEQKGAKFKIITHWRTQTIIKYYGIKSDYYYVSRNNFRFTFQSGRVLSFIQTPYLHFAGAITTYDNESKILFSSDLFGAFSQNWSLFASKNYMEGMKTFHEHYMPANEILRAAMNVFLSMDITMIAPQHGSIINENIRDYIIVLRDLECGSFLKPIHKDLAKSGGYRFVCSQIIQRLVAIFPKTEVLDALEGIEMTLNDDVEIIDFNYTGAIFWDLFFEKLLAKKGLQWLLIIEPYVKTLAVKYEIPLPQVYSSNLRRYEEEAIKLNKENEMLKEINQRLEIGLSDAMDRLILCPVTGIYNYEFYKSYIHSEVESIIEGQSKQNPCVLVISPDNIGKMRYSYGEAVIDETLKNLVYILNEIKSETDFLFRLQGTQFACYLHHSTKEKARNFAEQIRNEIATSEKFIERLTVSIGVASLDEVREQQAENIGEIFHEAAVNRLNYVKRNGKNMVFSEILNEKREEVRGEILIVDTDVVSIDVCKTFFENAGFNTISAKDGEEALQIAENRHISLILSEVMLPKMDGFILRERLLSGSSTKNIPFIILSYLKDDNSVQRALNLEVEHYFKKPFMMTELLGVAKIKIKGDA